MTERWIDADTYYGETRGVLFSGLYHRVSVYAIIIDRDRILMIKTSNNKWYFPGGGLNVGETLQDGVKREVWEELGVEVKVGELLYADDMIYYHDPADFAAQLVRLFYVCRPLTTEFHFQNAEERDAFLEIGWVSLPEPPYEEILPATWRALEKIRERIQIQE